MTVTGMSNAAVFESNYANSKQVDVSSSGGYTAIDSEMEKSTDLFEMEIPTSEVASQIKQMREEGEKQENTFCDLGKAIIIASRIAKGDIVPDEDDKFLLEKYPDMHLRAWMLRRSQGNPKEYGSVLDKNDGNNSRFDMFEFFEQTDNSVTSSIASIVATSADTSLNVTA